MQQQCRESKQMIWSTSVDSKKKPLDVSKHTNYVKCYHMPAEGETLGALLDACEAH
jgi:hypothetical protein